MHNCLLQSLKFLSPSNAIASIHSDIKDSKKALGHALFALSLPLDAQLIFIAMFALLEVLAGII